MGQWKDDEPEHVAVDKHTVIAILQSQSVWPEDLSRSHRWNILQGR